MNIYIENEKFAANVKSANIEETNEQGFYCLGTVPQ